MRTFEEKAAAWLDGQLPEKELPALQREAESRGETLMSPEENARLGSLLRKFSTAPALTNGDFFNHGILERIEKESPIAQPVQVAPSKSWFRIPRLAWFGGASLATAFILFLTIIPKKSESHSPEAYLAQIISARAADPNVSATAFHSEKSDMTILWLDGLDYVPQQSPSPAQTQPLQPKEPAKTDAR
ncbi:MAG TPA: hypothetical protein VIT21_13215 [Chthoniobacterales bacterium]